MMLVGLGQAGDRSSTVQTAALVTGVAVAALYCALLIWFVEQWRTGPITPRVFGWTLGISLVVALALFIAARTDDAGPVGVAGMGGALLGCMIGNLIAIRRVSRRGRRRRPHSPRTG